MRIRQFRWPGLALALPLLAGAAAPSVAVYPMPETLLPDLGNKVREPFTAKPGDVVMRGRITKTERVFVDDPVDVKIDRFGDSLTVGGELTPVIAPGSTDAVVGGNGRYYCGRDQRGRSAFRELMIGGIGSKFEAIVRFCFLDADSDGKFEKVFLAGARDKAMQAPIAIAPVRYHSAYLQQVDPGDMIQVRYRKFNPKTQKVELEIEELRAGTKSRFDYVLWSKPGLTTLEKEYPRLVTNPAKIPYPVVFNDVFGAAIGIDSVKPNGEATFTIKRNFRPTLFRPIQIQVRYVYIYI